ncbi:3D domain-containing protein [Candidatus Azambacteria bacterium]|nr:3D domain-containing protein [Candidatus Azambacteria bacterium]
MRSKHKLLVILFFLFLFCKPAILTMARKYLLCQQRIEPEHACDHNKTARTMIVTVTAYSSAPDQTDDSPFIMASGNRVYDGAIASNFLPMGTRVMLPETHGEKVFTVEDRTHRRFSNRIDIWMETREEALQFGIKRIAMRIL